MTVTTKCTTCEHRSVCKFTPDSLGEFEANIISALAPFICAPFIAEIRCPHYTDRRKTYMDYGSTGPIAIDCAHVNSTSDLEAYPTATLQEGYHAQQ